MGPGRTRGEKRAQILHSGLEVVPLTGNLGDLRDPSESAWRRSRMSLLSLQERFTGKEALARRHASG